MAFDQSRHDELAKKDAADLSEEEALELALLRSEVSLAEYDPSALKNEAERVVELPDRASATLGDVAADESQPLNVRADAQTAIDNPPPSSPVFQEQMNAQVAEAGANVGTPTTDPRSGNPTPSSTSSSTTSSTSTDSSKTSGSSTPSS